MITLYSLPQLSCGIITLLFGLFILSKNIRSAANQTFALLCFVTCTWQITYAINYNLDPHNIDLINLLFRIGYCGVTFIPTTMLHHVNSIATLKKYRNLTYFYDLYAVVSCYLILFTDKIISGTYLYFWGPYPKASSYHPIYLGLFIFVASFLFLILLDIVKIEEKSQKLANQLKYLLASYIIFYLASIDFLPNYGFEVYPLGSIPTTIYLLIIGYAIIKYELMDIKIVIHRGIVYSILITAITVFYLLAVLIFERLFQSIFGYNHLIPSMITAIVIAIVFNPLKDRIQYFVDQIFFKGSLAKIAHENELLKADLAQKEKFRAIASLASGIAHEVKNPLTSLKTFIEYFPEKKDDPEFLKKCSTILPHEINRIDDLIKELLNFAKPSPPNFETLNIDTVIDETLSLVQNKIQKNKIILIQKLDSNFQKLYIDPNKIKQALLNILLNAIEAMPNGGTLKISTRATSHESRAPNHLEIIIEDTGPGIDKDDLKHIFDPFFTKKDNGTGLGLAVTKEIVGQHGGTINVRSSSEGTKFIIKLPKSEAKA